MEFLRTRNKLLVFFALVVFFSYSFKKKEAIMDRLKALPELLMTPSNDNIDSLEFAPGHPVPFHTAVYQIEHAPAPRFKNGHTLLPNVLWMSPRYFGGLGNGGTTQQVIANSTAIMLSLAQRMNYSLVLPGTSYGMTGYDDPKTVPGAYIKLANDHPEFPAAVITFWAGANGTKCGLPKIPYIRRTDLPSHFYLQAGKTKRISPSAPVDSFVKDGLIMRCYFEKLCQNLKRPVQLISENGEVFKLFNKDLLEKDPLCMKDKDRLGYKTWEDYEAAKRLEKEKAVQKGFLDLPCFKNVIYSEYGVDGHRQYRHKYEVIKKVNTPINGQYYSTPDFYPRWPYNWKNWKGAWHGFKWIADCRTVEIADGDKLYSPFVSAGWDHREQNNIRPGQWLGLLKVLAATGAEFYYTGFFSLKEPFPKPENYAWQALMPAYAQAVTSHYENILRESDLLNLPSCNLSKAPDELIVARKVTGKEVYIISGTIQPSSNNIGSAPLSRITSIQIGERTLSFQIRRQGSTYVFDASGPSPVFYQLDDWHEYTHPSRWNTTKLLMEAELSDNSESSIIKTESKAVNDYTSFTSYVQLNGNTLNYHLESNDRLKYLWVRVRGNGNITASADGKELDAGKSQSRGWNWVRISERAGSIKVLSVAGNLQLDKLLLTSDNNSPTDL